MTLQDLQGRATITVQELATLMSCSRGSAYSAVHRGQVPSLRINRRIVIPVPALLRLLENGSNVPHPD